jgi:hypothetical protein
LEKFCLASFCVFTDQHLARGQSIKKMKEERRNKKFEEKKKKEKKRRYVDRN